MRNSFYNEIELNKLGFKRIGSNVRLSKKASFYSPESIVLGNNIRIDDFCILSGNITIGNYVHIAANVCLYGKFGIRIGDYCGVSPSTTLLSATDDFSGEYMVGPLVDECYTNVTGGEIILNDFVQIGANCVVMPNIAFGEGSAIGAMSLVNKSVDSWTISYGIPAKTMCLRKKNIIELARKHQFIGSSK